MRRLSRILAGLHCSSKEMHRRRFASVAGVTLMLVGLTASDAGGVTTIPVLWTAGGLDAGTTGAGQAARMTADASGGNSPYSNIAGARTLRR